VAADLSADPRWAAHREAAAAAGRESVGGEGTDGSAPFAACWAVPVLGPDGAPAAALAVHHRRPREPSDRELSLLEGFARLAAVALGRRRAEAENNLLLVRETAARAAAEEARRRFEFLAGASAELASSLDYAEVLRRLARLIVPRLADWCLIDLLRRDGTVRRVAVAHASPADPEVLRELEARHDGADGDATPAVLPIGVSAVRADFPLGPDAVAGGYPDDLRLLERLGMRSCIAAPLVSRGRKLGMMLLAAAESGRTYGREDETLAEDLARRAAAAADNARLLLRLQNRQKAVRDLAARLADAEDAERRRLARDLHDSVGQALSALKLRLEAARAGPAGGGNDASGAAGSAGAAGVAAELLPMLEDVIRQTRTLMFELYPPTLDSLGLAASLQWWAERTGPPAGLRISVSESGPPRPLSPAAAGYAFRAARELLNNAAKHARASEALVSIRWEPGWLRLAVADDGAGFDPSSLGRSGGGGGLGLAAIREHVGHMGGRVQIESEPGHGTRVIITLPVG
jgi:signal transduction histidine kinase